MDETVLMNMNFYWKFIKEYKAKTMVHSLKRKQKHEL